MNPSDSGLLDGLAPPPGYAPPGQGTRRSPSDPPPRSEYDAPPPAEANAEAIEESLRNVPMPEGLMPRLRSMVEGLED